MKPNAQGPERAGPVTVQLHRTVSMIDVDRMQIHFSSYFRWMDEAYSRLLVELGHPLEQLFDERFATPVVDARCSYLAPVGLGGAVDVATCVHRVGRSSFEIAHEFTSSGSPIASGSTTHVWVEIIDSEPVSRPVPEWLGQAVVAPEAP